MRASIARGLRLVKQCRVVTRYQIGRLTADEAQESVPITMRKFLPLLLCLSLSIFTLARGMKPAHVFAPETGAKASADDANTEEDPASDDDDSTPSASNDEGEEANNDDGDGAAGDEGTGADKGTGSDDGGDEDDDDGGSDHQGK